MAKLHDKLMNRIIEGKLELSPEDNIQSAVVNALKGQDINVDGITSKGIANTGNIANIGDIATTGKITGGEIIENMSGYSFVKITTLTWNPIYVGAVKNGNKVTLVAFGTYTETGEGTNNLGTFILPKAVADKIYPFALGNFVDVVDIKEGHFFGDPDTEPKLANFTLRKTGELTFNLALRKRSDSTFASNTTYTFRYEVTFLLGENLAPQNP